MENFIKYYIRNFLYLTASLFSSGTIMQAFLSAMNVDSGKIGLFITSIYFINIISTMLFSSIADKSNDIIKSISIFMIPIGILYAGYIPFCILSDINPLIVFTCVLIIGILQSILMAIRNMYDYKLPYNIIPIEKVNILMAVDGIISGISGIFVSLLMVRLMELFAYFQVMAVCFASAVVMVTAAAMINRSMKRYEDNKDDKEQKKYSFFDLLKNRNFFYFIIPNFTRGITTGVITMAAVIGLNTNTFNNVNVTYLVTASTAANITGSVCFVFLSKYLKSSKICLYGSLSMCAMLLMIFNSQPLFLTGYFIASLGMMVVNYAVPLYIYEIMPYEIIGKYTSWRMILTTGGTTLATAFIGYFINSVPLSLILIISVICQLICGIGYYAYNK